MKEDKHIQTFTIYGRLDGLNDYTKANRSNRYQGNNVKKRNENKVKEAILLAKLKTIEHYPIELSISWYEPNKRRDIDNITFATKFIQDSLTALGVIKDDSQKYINKLTHNVYTDKERPRVEVTIIEEVET